MDSEQLELIRSQGQVQFYPLHGLGGILNIGRHPDNDIVVDEHGVGLFHGLLDLRSRPILFVPLDAGGQGGTPVELTEWHGLQIGESKLELVRPSSTTAPVPPLPQTGPAQQTVLSATSIQANLPQWTVLPGQATSQTISVKNGQDFTATFQIRFWLDRPDWLRLGADAITLQPGESARFQLEIIPPADAVPGRWPITWRIESPQYPGWSHTKSVELLIQPLPRIEVADLSPPSFRSRFLRRSGQTNLRLQNSGNASASVQVVPVDPMRQLVLKVINPAEKGKKEEGKTDGELVLEPTQTIELNIHARRRRGGLFGFGAARFPYSVQVAVPGGASISRDGTFESRPLINIGLLALVIFLGVLLALYIFREQVAEQMDRIVFSAAVAEAGLGGRMEQAEGNVAPPSISLEEYRRSQTAKFAGTTSVGTSTAAAGGTFTSYEEMFRRIADQYGLDWRTLAAQSFRESSFDVHAVGPAGEYGLMQVHPATWNEWAPLVHATDPWDPYENVLVGAAYYSFLRSYFADNGYSDPKWAIVAYNWGPERVLTLLDRSGRWSEIPLAQRMYAADILTGASTVETRLRAFDARNQP